MRVAILGRSRGPSRERSGAALVLSLVVVMVLIALGLSFSQLAAATTGRLKSAVHRKEAFYMAEAGLAEAYAGLLCARTGNVGSPEAPARFGNGLFWVDAEDLGDGFVQLDATGMVRSGRATLSLVAARGEISVASLGIYSEAALRVPPGTVIDGYDSSVGSHAAQAERGRSAQLGSNATIEISGTRSLPTFVYGDVTPGPRRDVRTTRDVVITGSTGPALRGVSLPPVALPDVSLGAGRSHTDRFPLLVRPGTSGIEFLTIGSGAEVVIQGPSTVVVGTVSVARGGELRFDTSEGPVDLFVTRGFDLQSGSFLSTSGSDPSLVTVQIAAETARPVRLSSKAEFHGVFYAPRATVELASAFEVFGALVGHRLTFLGPARLHFDRHLAELEADGALPALVSWRLVDMGNEAVAGLADPFRILGIQRADALLPADAHADQWLEVTYTNAVGGTDTYAGPESAFDWTLVTEVTSVTRDGVAVPGSVVAGNPKDPSAPPENPDPLMALVIDPALSSSDLKAALNASAPISAAVATAAIDRSSPMNSSDLKDVLQTSSPLADGVLSAAVERGPLSDGDLKSVLIQNSPLATTVLDDLLARVPALNASDLAAVLAAQGGGGGGGEEVDD